MRSKLKTMFSSICIVAILSVAIEGCASKDVVSEEHKTEDNIVTAMPEESKVENSMMIPQSLNDEELEKAARNYQEYLKSISNKLPEIWSDINVEDYNIIITNGNNNYYVSKESYKEFNSKQDNSDMETVLKMLQYAVGMYQPTTYKGKNITAMHLMKMNDKCTEEDYMRNFVTLMHESFHLHTQAEWKNIDLSKIEDKEQSNMRASNYPLDDQPRIMRTMLYNCLYSALQTENQKDELKYLESAKYWYDKWVEKYADEYSDIKETDLAEGTAEYFGNEIKRILQAEGYTLVTPKEFATESQSADAESYNLGDLAIQLLKKQGKFQLSDFQDAGKTPLESLFANIKESKKEKVDIDLEKIISDNISKMNAQISQCFSGYIEKDLKGEMTYIGVSSKSLTGIMSEGFYYLTEIGKTGWQNASINNLKMQVNNKSLLEYEDMILIPVNEKEITVKDNVISSIKADGIILNDSAKYEKKKDAHGNIIYHLLEE